MSMVDGSGPAPANRWPEIDLVKGFAILCVLLIHAQPLVGTLLHQYLINRAVPIFVVVFGTTSELWWRARASSSWWDTASRWYRTRLWRLMVPFWGMLVVWWAMTLACSPRPVGLATLLVNLTGYVPRIGTGWFVTLILELVVLFPLVRGGPDFIGRWPWIVCTLGILTLAHIFTWQVVDGMRVLLLGSMPGEGWIFYFWLFAPVWFFSVSVGMLLAHRRAHFRPATGLIAVAVAVGGIVLHASLPSSSTPARVLPTLIDVPVVIALLAFLPLVAAWKPVGAGLTWCGQFSWGLYLGQLLVHNAASTFGIVPTNLSTELRWVYFAALLVGAVGFVTIGNAVRGIDARDWLPAMPHTRDH